LEWVTSNLLDLSRLDAGVGELLLEPVETTDVLQAAVGPFRERARAQATAVEIQASAGDTAICDRAHMEMAIGNLVDNALKHTGAADRIVVSASIAGPAEEDQPSSGAEGADGKIAISVVDTGPGFAPGESDRVFERFYRGSSAAAGAGLGLAVVRSVAAAHGGTVEAGTSESGGARVTIRIPRSPSNS
jgi:signal transduction histidine kinase